MEAGGTETPITIALPDGTVVTRFGAAVIGRDPSCDIVLASGEVSRRHAAIEIKGGAILLTDNSANGTLVNGQLVVRATVPVDPTAALRIGPYDLLLKVNPYALASVEATPNRTADPGVKPGGVAGEMRRRIHRQLLDNLDLVTLDRKKMDDPAMRPKVQAALRRIIADLGGGLPASTDRERLIAEMTDEALGLGPLEQLLADDTVSEIMVVTPQTIFVERHGRIELTDLRFTDDETVRAVIERIVTPLGRRIDESTPLVDARLKDGSRVNGIIKPLAIRGACITIRKFAKRALSLEDLIQVGTLTPQIARFLTRSVVVKKNILVSGGTGSGKTTLLNVFSGSIPTVERIITIEDAAELRLPQPHVVSLESRPPNLEGKGEITIRDLVRNALRMRPDRIIVGECRGGEALDMMQAMNTGHEGSMTTIHANSPREALVRLETLCLMAGLQLPSAAVRDQIAQSIHVIVHQSRLSDGSRRITSVSEVAGMDDGGDIRVRDIFQFVRTGTGARGEVQGEFRLTGYLPSFLDQFISHGLVREARDYL
jgi:pilus assembly protein CpaF